MTHHQITKKIPKFRPYLSMEELDLLISLCTSALCTSPAPNLQDILIIKSSARALMKTKISVQSGIQGAAYIATPIPSLDEKLGFASVAPSIPQEAPDFHAMMASLSFLEKPNKQNL